MESGPQKVESKTRNIEKTPLIPIRKLCIRPLRSHTDAANRVKIAQLSQSSQKNYLQVTEAQKNNKDSKKSKSRSQIESMRERERICSGVAEKILV